MPYYLGIDTSNYTTSTAIYDSEARRVIQEKKPLPVAEGKLGLKQSDAVFLHVKALGPLLEKLLPGVKPPLAAVAASGSPRDGDGSYMPCFLVGLLGAQTAAAAAGVPIHTFSHQAGHVTAALFSAGRLELMNRPFLAFHLSGGTTQCLLVEPDAKHMLSISTVAETLDLNAGQAVDRVGGMLGLAFPAGSALEKLALKSRKTYAPSPTMKGVHCCLSGLENQCAGRLAAGEAPEDIARFCLDSLACMVLEMTRRVLELYPGLPLVYAGGVMSNRLIRGRIEAAYPAFFAEPAFSCDNAAGIAVLCALAEGGISLC